jgi:subfamily B ATP-binding cassette protein MsbA
MEGIQRERTILPIMSEDRPFLIYRRLLRCVTGGQRYLAFALLALVVHSALTLLVPWLVQDLFHDSVLNRRTEGTYAALGLILGVMLVLSATRYVADDKLELVSLRLMQRLRLDIVGKLARLHVSHFIRSRAGDAVSRAFNDVQALKSFLSHACFTLGNDLLRIGGSVAMLVFLSWRLALVALIMALVGVGVVAGTSRWIRRRYREVQAALSDMTSMLSEQVRALPSIQAYGATGYEGRRFADKAREHCRHAVLANRIHAASKAVVNFLGAIGIVYILAFGAGELTSGGSVTPGGLPLEQLLGFAMYVALLVEPLTRLSRTNFEIQQSLAAGRRIFELLDLPEDQQDGLRTRETSPACGPAREVGRARPKGMLQFESVHFHYRPEEPVLRGINLAVRPGEPLAIVGASGAGKSTLAHLALRFYEPVQGRLSLDGYDIRHLPVADLRRAIGWLGQEPFVFGGTVAENIRYGCWDASGEEIERAARLACADSFIRELPRGYDSHIGECGLDLSGGQRARLALARVIVRSPSIVILDEASAALDTETESRLWKGLASWMAERTTLIIAHRLLTVLGCPRIVVIDEGRIAGDGTAEHLQRTCPAFERIFMEQMNLGQRAA